MLANWYEDVMFWTTIATLILQFYILFLTRYKSPKSMEEYCYFLNMLTVSVFSKFSLFKN